MYPLVRELAVDGIPVTVTCRVLKLARQPYYRWLAAPVGRRELDRAHLANAVFDAHADDPEFGYRLLADEARDAGHTACDRVVWRICRDQQWWSAFGKKRGGSGKKPGPPAHDDQVQRDFTAEGKLYLCAVKDVYSNRIVGYSISDRMKARLAVDALNSAVARRAVAVADAAGCIVHSDRGSQFRSRDFWRRCATTSWSGRWARSGPPATTRRWSPSSACCRTTCWTGSAGPLTSRRSSDDFRQELRIAIITWIERTYHRRRRQTRLGRLTPIEYETIMTNNQAQAA